MAITLLKANEMKIEALTNPWYVMMVGLPGSGKSTIVEKIRKQKDFTLLSTDHIIEQFANVDGITYSEAFPKYIDRAQNVFNFNMKNAFDWKYNIIHDQTNLGRSKRQKILKQIPEGYFKVLVNVWCEPEHLQERLANRPGKIISPKVLEDMERRYDYPLLNEGFDEYVFHNTTPGI